MKNLPLWLKIVIPTLVGIILIVTVTGYIIHKRGNQKDSKTNDVQIMISDGNIVEISPDGNQKILVDKNDYEEIQNFSYVAVSPNGEYMCFLAQTIVPIWMYYSNIDGTEVNQVALAENCIWSNNSTMIAYTNHTTDVSPHDVYVYSLSTETSTNFTSHLSDDTNMRVYRDPVWSDDDSTITSAFTSFDSDNNWSQSSGISIITILTGEVTDDFEASIDTSDWFSFSHNKTNLSFRYPRGWTAEEDCEFASDTELCPIKVTNGNYVWTFQFDPFVTGGGFGYLFDMVSLPSLTEQNILSIDTFTPYILTHYYDGAAISSEMGNPTIPSGNVWGWSVTFTDPDDKGSLGFGPGVMYDDIDNNFWSISYEYELPLLAEGGMDYTDLPLRGDTGLTEALNTMNAISESVELPN